MSSSNFPPQSQEGRTSSEQQMNPQPKFQAQSYRGANRLQNKVALITGGDSGIGRSVAVVFAREGAKVAINYLPEEQEDAETTKKAVESEGGQCLLIPGDLTWSRFCTELVEKTVQHFGRLDSLIMCHGTQRVQQNFLDITDEQLERTFRVNAITPFYLCRAAVRHLQPGSTIIFTSTVAFYKGDPQLIDYTSSEGAVVSLMRSLSHQLIKRDIRVNCVATGDVWTPLIPSSYPAQMIPNFGHRNLFDRAAQPEEIAPAYVYLASYMSSYVSGQTIHLNGGIICNT